jgi:hypothetical protein
MEVNKEIRMIVFKSIKEVLVATATILVFEELRKAFLVNGKPVLTAAGNRLVNKYGVGEAYDTAFMAHDNDQEIVKHFLNLVRPHELMDNPVEMPASLGGLVYT